MKSNIYLLTHRNKQRFKVGKANDIIGRARSFGLHEIDWASSAGFAVASDAVALRFERVVLLAFQDWRIPADQVVAEGCVSGATEWLHIDCRERVEDLLRHTVDIIPQVRIDGPALQAQVEAIVEPMLRAAAERERRKDEKHQRDIQRNQRLLERAQASRKILLTSLADARSNFWEELLRHIADGTIVGTCRADNSWNLILMSEEIDETLWQADSRSTAFSWPEGGGSLVDSVAEWSEDAARISVVSLGSCLDGRWPSREIATTVLGDVAAFLRSLIRVDAEHLKTTLWTDPWHENEETSLWKSSVVQSFIDLHLPVLLSRKAAKFSYQLFE